VGGRSLKKTLCHTPSLFSAEAMTGLTSGRYKDNKEAIVSPILKRKVDITS
jgi:hypothetical protein